MRLFLLFLVAFVAGGRAAPVERDLGQGLLYHRVTELPGDLPAPNPAKQPALVLDLRYVRADGPAAIAAQGWLKFYAGPRSPVFVLANPETSAPVRQMLEALRRTPGMLVLGRPGRDFEPDLPIQTAPENERRAYDALASGTAVAALLKDNPDKIRNDEASLNRDRLADAAADSATEEIHGRKVSSPIDAALQRAVHLHRALVALRKL